MASRRTASARSRAAAGRKETPRPRPPGGGRAPSHLDDESGYWRLSMRPLHVLVFLTPVVALYEFGSALYLTGRDAGTQRTIAARKMLSDFFELFGAAGLFMPGLALVAVLLVWHVLIGDRWRVRPSVLAAMVAESAAWTMPLLVLSAVHRRATLGVAMAGVVSGGASSIADQSGGLLSLPAPARLTISVGAGLYEEMLFRLVGIALIHFVAADLLRVNRTVASVLSVAAAAVAFALYHDTTLPSGATDWARVVFYVLAGLYLGMVYVLRGLGVVVATHAIYDAMVLVFLPEAGRG